MYDAASKQGFRAKRSGLGVLVVVAWPLLKWVLSVFSFILLLKVVFGGGFMDVIGLLGCFGSLVALNLYVANR
jgi:hypothetical protein